VQHKTATTGFTSKYLVHKLVWYQTFNNVQEALLAEKTIKKWRREKKIKLVEQSNPLWEEIVAL
jgi:putative endonuclease